MVLALRENHSDFGYPVHNNTAPLNLLARSRDVSLQLVEVGLHLIRSSLPMPQKQSFQG
jgi:hypothetical protein